MSDRATPYGPSRAAGRPSGTHHRHRAADHARLRPGRRLDRPDADAAEPGAALRPRPARHPRRHRRDHAARRRHRPGALRRPRARATTSARCSWTRWARACSSPAATARIVYRQPRLCRSHRRHASADEARALERVLGRQSGSGRRRSTASPSELREGRAGDGRGAHAGAACRRRGGGRRALVPHLGAAAAGR